MEGVMSKSKVRGKMNVVARHSPSTQETAPFISSRCKSSIAKEAGNCFNIGPPRIESIRGGFFEFILNRSSVAISVRRFIPLTNHYACPRCRLCCSLHVSVTLSALEQSLYALADHECTFGNPRKHGCCTGKNTGYAQETQ